MSQNELNFTRMGPTMGLPAGICHIKLGDRSVSLAGSAIQVASTVVEDMVSQAELSSCIA